MTITTLSISPRQHGKEMFVSPTPALRAGSTTVVCHNLRRNSEGNTLEYAPPPELIGTSSGKPFLADKRGEGFNLLRQEDDGSIIVDGFLNPTTGDYISSGSVIGRVESPVIQAEPVGQFVVLRFNDNRLGYMLYDNDLQRYTLLGELPRFNLQEVKAVEHKEMTIPIESVKFRNEITDIRAGLDSDARKRIGDAMKAAWEELRHRAANSQVWMQPIDVRLAWRLADGSLLHVSEAQRIGATEDVMWQCGGRATLQPVFDTDGNAVGTQGGSLSAIGYKIAFTPDKASLGVWDKVVAAVEIWVTEECDPLDVSSLPVCGIQTSSHESPAIAAQLTMRPLVSLSASLDATPYGVVSSLLPIDSIGVQSPRRDIYYSIDGAVTASRLLNPEEVRCILGHDGFLHLATSDGLITSQRGTPFSISSCTPGDWSDTRTMAAQIWGGGAYTRQIIYVARDSGMAALAHDIEGRHTNCRSICRHAPVSEDFIAKADSAVYMLLDDGALASLTDTKIRILATGIDGCRCLCYDSRFGELWLLPKDKGGHCVVIGRDLDDVSTREYLNAVQLRGAAGLLMQALDNGLTHILSPSHTPEEESSSNAPCRWMAETEMKPSEEMWRIANCGIAGENVDVILRIGQANPYPDVAEQPQTLTQMRIKGEPRGFLRLHFRPGATQSGITGSKGSWRAEISGRLKAIYHFSVGLPYTKIAC